MRLLLDTHALIWWDNDELPEEVVRRIQRADEVFVSAASAWEIAIKSDLGKIKTRVSIGDVIDDYGFSELPILAKHADALKRLPRHHRDPFDRILICQALVEELVLVSTDRAFRKYDVPVVWK